MRFFKNAASKPAFSYMPQPGDIKYKDLNADGIINQYDQTAIGNKKPAVLLGATIAIRVANFDFRSSLFRVCFIFLGAGHPCPYHY